MNLVALIMKNENVSHEEANNMLWDALHEIEMIQNNYDTTITAEEVFTDITGLDAMYLPYLI